MKVYGYIRVSSAGQAEKDGPVRQGAAIAKFIEANKLEFAGEFEDLGVSGDIEGLTRPGFLEMLTRAAENGVEAIVVERMDRLARDLLVSEIVFRELQKRNLKLFCTDQGLNDLVTADADPTRKMLRQILGAVAQYDKDSLVVKLRVARERKRIQHGKCEGRKAYGEKPAERQARELILQLHEQGFGYGTIAKHLTLGGVHRRSGETIWLKQHVSSFMANIRKRKKREKKVGVYERTEEAEKA